MYDWVGFFIIKGREQRAESKEDPDRPVEWQGKEAEQVVSLSNIHQYGDFSNSQTEYFLNIKIIQVSFEFQ